VIVNSGVLQKDKKSWDKCLPYAEFSYNNSYQESLKMSPFEVLFGRKCRTPLFWNEPEENHVFGSEILREAKMQVQVVRENLQLAQSRQKSYADHRRRKLSFKVIDFVYLKVSPIRGFRHYKIQAKPTARYIGPFKILEQRGEVAYQLELPPQLSDVHDLFHVSQLRKCLRVSKEQIPLEELTVGEDLTYQEYLVKILDTSEKATRNNHYKMCKVQWSNHKGEEATWEKEDQLKAKFSDIFSNLSKSRGRDSS
jgi:hypothetical protein